MKVRRTLAPGALALAFLLALPIGAQPVIARADTLFRNGRVFAAETLYYYAARLQPRDPAARLALGRYLAARGALKVGAVLMEEARYFGGDARLVAAYLAPVYAQLDDYKSIVTLPGSVLPAAERTRAEWLRDNVPRITGPEQATVRYVPADSVGVGTVRIAIGRDTVEARLDPRISGLVLGPTWTRRGDAKTFGTRIGDDYSGMLGVTREVRIGGIVLHNVATRYEATLPARQARVGLDLIGRLAPTFDPEARTITLRSTGKATDVDGERLPTLAYPTGIWLVTATGVAPLQSGATHPLVRGMRWTLNPRRGEIVVGR